MASECYESSTRPSVIVFVRAYVLRYVMKICFTCCFVRIQIRMYFFNNLEQVIVAISLSPKKPRSIKKRYKTHKAEITSVLLFITTTVTYFSKGKVCFFIHIKIQNHFAPNHPNQYSQSTLKPASTNSNAPWWTYIPNSIDADVTGRDATHCDSWQLPRDVPA